MVLWHFEACPFVLWKTLRQSLWILYLPRRYFPCCVGLTLEENALQLLAYCLNYLQSYTAECSLRQNLSLFTLVPFSNFKRDRDSGGSQADIVSRLGLRF